MTPFSGPEFWELSPWEGRQDRHFYFSHRPSPLTNSTLGSNTLHGVESRTLGRFLVNFWSDLVKNDQNRPKPDQKTDRKPTQNWPSPGSRQASTSEKRGGSVAEIKCWRQGDRMISKFSLILILETQAPKKTKLNSVPIRLTNPRGDVRFN